MTIKQHGDAGNAASPSATLTNVLAELLDNAAQFSRSDAPVPVDARLLGDRVVVQIIDQGLGIDPQQRAALNQRLSAPPRVDVAAVQAMGLTVVGLLAARYGIGVELRAGRPRGTVAEVTLPLEVFRVVSAPTPPVRDEQVAAPPPLPRLLERAPGSWPIPAPRTPLDAPASQLALPAAGGADETAELPIFEEVRASGWFTTTDLNTGGEGWRSAADEGWRAAGRAATASMAATTERGLPKRVPQAHLVPGGVETASDRPEPTRDPARVSAAMTAYARGVSASRARQPAAVAASAAVYDMERS